jgi:hypothetical protein
LEVGFALQGGIRRRLRGFRGLKRDCRLPLLD